MSRPLLSVVIPAWNREDTIERAVRSVLGQTLPDLEVVVVDNGSTDATVARIEAIRDSRLTLRRLPSNVGPSAARNAGASVARAPFLGFLDSDDELEPTWAETLIEATARENVIGASCGYRVPEGTVRVPEPLGAAYFGLRACFQAGTVLVQAKIFDAIGAYAEALWYGENTELGLRIASYCHSHSTSLAAVDQPLLVWHHKPSGRYDDRRRMEAAEYTLARHSTQLSRDAFLFAAQYATAGGAGARVGERRRARRHFWRAFRIRPTARQFARFLSTTNPWTCRIVWQRHSRRIGA